MANPDGKLQFVNSAWAKMHSYGTEDLTGKDLSIFHTEEQLNKVSREKLHEYFMEIEDSGNRLLL